MEKIEPERTAKFVIGISKAGFVVELIALGELGKLQIRGRRTVGVKDFERVEFAIAIDHCHRPVIGKFPIYGIV